MFLCTESLSSSDGGDESQKTARKKEKRKQVNSLSLRFDSALLKKTSTLQCFPHAIDRRLLSLAGGGEAKPVTPEEEGGDWESAEQRRVEVQTKCLNRG